MYRIGNIRKAFRKAPAGVWLIHISFLVMIVGGICTACLSDKGGMHLYPLERTRSYISDDGKVRSLPESVELLSFDIVYYPDSRSPKDYRATLLTENGDTLRISMNHTGPLPGGYTLCQTSYDEEGGTWLSVTHDPVGRPLVYTGFLIFVIGVAVSMRRRLSMDPMRRPTAYALAVAAICLIICLIRLNPGKGTPIPVLATWWLPVHVGFAAAGYVVLASALPMAVAALVKKSGRLVSLALDLTASGVFLLGLGIIVGALWADVSWGRYWGWDPKETWALVTFIVCSLPLHRRLGLRRRPVVCAVCLILAVLAIAMTFWGVRYLPSLHSYY